MSIEKPEDNLPLHLPLSDFKKSKTETSEQKPTWRGWIHAAAIPVVIAGGVLLIVFANGPWAKFAAVVFFVCSFLLFGNSALYHRFNWKPRTKLVLKRIDHANIFLLIAGSYTPITLAALPEAKGLLLISLIWASAVLGIGFRVFWINAPRWLYVPIYLGMGWAAIAFIADFFAANTSMMVLVLVGGLFYSVGAAFYGFKWPNLVPGHFGFHELFHACTVAAFVCHWTAALIILMHPAAASIAG
jgi:hemolysin III